MADLISSRYPQTKIYACKRWHHSDLTNIRHLLDKITFIDCDLTDPLSTADLVKISKPEVIFHFAAESFVSLMEESNEIYEFNIMEQSICWRQYVSTHQIHSYISQEVAKSMVILEEDLPIAESTNINPVNPYAVTKVAQDLIAKVYFDSYGTNVIRTRSFNHEGPRRKNVLVYHGTHIKYVELKGFATTNIENRAYGRQKNFTRA